MTIQPANLCTISTDEPMKLSDCVELTMRKYFTDLDGTEVTGVYQFVLNEIELPLFKCVLEHTQGNQSKAAEILGLNRGTLRKKLKEHNLI